MRYLVGFVFVLALGVMPMVGCGEEAIDRDAPVGAEEAETVCSGYCWECAHDPDMPFAHCEAQCVETLTKPGGGHVAVYYRCATRTGDCHGLDRYCLDL